MKELLIETKRAAYNYETLLEPGSSARVSVGLGDTRAGGGFAFFSKPNSAMLMALQSFPYTG